MNITVLIASLAAFFICGLVGLVVVFWLVEVFCEWG